MAKKPAQEITVASLPANWASQQLILEAVPTAMLITRFDGSILYTNRRFIDQFGLEAERNILNYYADPAERQDVLEKFSQQGNVQDYELRMKKADGSPVWVLLSVQPFDFDGEPVMLSSLLDITGRKQVEAALRESELIFSSFLEHSPVYVFFKDKDIRSLRLSRNYEQMLGMPLEEALGKSMDELFPSDLARSMVADDRRILEKGEVVEVVEEFNGRLFETTKFPIFKDSRPDMLAGFTLDITERRRAEERLVESERQLLEAQQLTRIGHWKLDPRTLQVEGSAELFRIFGLQSDGATLDAFASVVHPEDREYNLSHIQLDKETGQSWDIEHRLLMKDGTLKWVHTIGRAICDPSGKPEMLIGTVQDITDSKRAGEALRESEEKYRYLFTHMQNGFALHEVVLDETGRVVDYVFIEVNEAFEQQTGLRREAILGKRVTQVIPGIENDPVDWIGTYGRVALTGESISFENYAAPLEKWYSVIAYSPKVNHFATLFFDITQRKQAEEAVHRINAELEMRVARRTAQLESANRELEAFAYSISHDLRAPLRAIGNYSKIIQEEYASMLPVEGRELFAAVCSGAQQMETLIADLLKFSRLGWQPLNKQVVEPGELVHQALHLLEQERAGRRVDISVGQLPPCEGDSVLLLQVWVNLIANALKFTRPREVAQIEVGCRAGEGGEQVYYVRDNGVGFDMQYAGRIFEVFHRLHRSEEFEGSGVGLALVQRIVERHGGRVWAEAQPGIGATFYFTV